MNLLPKKKQRIGKVSSTKAEVKQFETVKYVQENKQKKRQKKSIMSSIKHKKLYLSLINY